MTSKRKKRFSKVEAPINPEQPIIILEGQVREVLEEPRQSESKAESIQEPILEPEPFRPTVALNQAPPSVPIIVARPPMSRKSKSNGGQDLHGTIRTLIYGLILGVAGAALYKNISDPPRQITIIERVEPRAAAHEEAKLPVIQAPVSEGKEMKVLPVPGLPVLPAPKNTRAVSPVASAAAGVSIQGVGGAGKRQVEREDEGGVHVELRAPSKEAAAPAKGGKAPPSGALPQLSSKSSLKPAAKAEATDATKAVALKPLKAERLALE